VEGTTLSAPAGFRGPARYAPTLSSHLPLPPLFPLRLTVMHASLGISIGVLQLSILAFSSHLYPNNDDRKRIFKEVFK
jgi:hypothetical protein